MSGHAQLAQTGLPTLVIGGAAYPIGGWMALVAVLVLGGMLLTIKFGFRRNLDVGQASFAEAPQADEPQGTPESGKPRRRHGK